MYRNTEHKGLDKQLLIKDMRSHAARNDASVVQESQAKKKKDDFQSDDESDTQSNIEIEANDHLHI